MNDIKLNSLTRVVFNTYLRKELMLLMDIYHARYGFYFRVAFEPAKGRVVPFYHLPSARRDVIDWIAEQYENHKTWLEMIAGNREVEGL